MTIAAMRAAISRLYGPSWAGKVEKFSDARVAAVYERLRSSGKLKK